MGGGAIMRVRREVAEFAPLCDVFLNEMDPNSKRSQNLPAAATFYCMEVPPN